jgi:hypothetical protein
MTTRKIGTPPNVLGNDTARTIVRLICAVVAALLFVGVKSGAQTPGTIATIAGNGTSGYTGDGGLATSAEIGSSYGIAVDSSGNLYIADIIHSVIRKVTASTGDISTIAGNGTQGFSGDGGSATSAELDEPLGIAVDSSGNLYIADSNNNRIRKVNTSGTISTVAGNGTEGFSGDGGLATSAELNEPYAVGVDSSGNLYISDGFNHRIRKVNTSGYISTVAGNGTYGYSGDGGPATSAEISVPSGLAFDSSNNVYLADNGNYVVRKITVSTGYITTVVGNGTRGFSGDGGPATSAELTQIGGVALDSSNNIFVVDIDNYRIREVSASSGDINTVAGDGTDGFSGDGGPATSAEIGFIPNDGVKVHGGHIYILDDYNSRVREVY